MTAEHARRVVSPHRLAYPALVVATQMLDALALILARGHGTEANPMMAAAIGTIGLAGIVALKVAVGIGIGAVVWTLDLRHRGAIALICLIGCLGALSALIAVI